MHGKGSPCLRYHIVWTKREMPERWDRAQEGKAISARTAEEVGTRTRHSITSKPRKSFVSALSSSSPTALLPLQTSCSTSRVQWAKQKLSLHSPASLHRWCFGQKLLHGYQLNNLKQSATLTPPGHRALLSASHCCSPAASDTAILGIGSTRLAPNSLP